MKSHDLNWKVAEALGWKKHPRDEWVVINPKYPLSVQPLNTIPDYSGDLNIMHEVERGMDNSKWWIFINHLTEICGGGTALAISATASQRANAFLKSI